MSALTKEKAPGLKREPEALHTNNIIPQKERTMEGTLAIGDIITPNKITYIFKNEKPARLTTCECGGVYHITSIYRIKEETLKYYLECEKCHKTFEIEKFWADGVVEI